jgi:hypothetical protein
VLSTGCRPYTEVERTLIGMEWGSVRHADRGVGAQITPIRKPRPARARQRDLRQIGGSGATLRLDTGCAESSGLRVAGSPGWERNAGQVLACLSRAAS